MVVVLIFLGACVGFLLGNEANMVFGGVLGLLLALFIDIKERLSRMEKLEGLLNSQKSKPSAIPIQANDPSKPDIEPSVASTTSDLDLTQPAAAGMAPVTHAIPRPRPVTTQAKTSSSKEPLDELFDNTVRKVMEFFTTGNVVAKVGILLLFVGIAFLLNYASRRYMLPVEFRLIGAVLGAMVLLGIGWRLRIKNAAFALTLQGGGIAILYLTVFFAFKTYHLLPTSMTFVLLAFIALFSVCLSLMQNSPGLITLGLIGGFAAPLLASDGGGNHIFLFSYYALLNLVILSVAWHRSWRFLNLLGFAFTFIIGTAWGVLRYQPEYMASCEFFLVLFFLMYVALSIMFTAKNGANFKDVIDTVLVFGTPLVCFGIQSKLMAGIPFALAWSAIIASAFYCALALIYLSKNEPRWQLLGEAFLGITTVFLCLAVPLAFEGRSVATLWAIEGAAVIWIGVRQNNFFLRMLGSVVQIGAGFYYFFDIDPVLMMLIHQNTPNFVEVTTIFNSFYLSTLVLAVAGFFSAYMLQTKKYAMRRDFETEIAAILFVWALLWWAFGGSREIVINVTSNYQLSWLFNFFIASTLIAWLVYETFNFKWLRKTAMSLLPIMIVFAAEFIQTFDRPFAYGGMYCWIFGALCWFTYLYRRDTKNLVTEDWWHTTTMWLMTVVLVLQLHWWIGTVINTGTTWQTASVGLVPALIIFLIFRAKGLFAWPIQRHLEAYQFAASAPLAAFIFCWIVYVNFTSPGNTTPIGYLPILNPLDIVVLFSLITMLRWQENARGWLQANNIELDRKVWFMIVSLLVFLWLNAMVSRTVYQWAGVPFNFDAMMSSPLLQVSLSVMWAVLAVMLTGIGNSMQSRMLWKLGAALICLVILKLLLVDMTQIDTIQRIISFIGVGVLLIIVGYLAPLPPKKVKP